MLRFIWERRILRTFPLGAGLAIALVASAPHNARAQIATSPSFAWVDSLVREQSRRLGLPGVAVVVVKNGTPLLTRAYGTRDIRQAGAVVAVATPFNIASLTKPFTATVATQLVREGKLALDAPARRYLEWLPVQYASITVRQLLTHTSGIVRDVRSSNEDDPDAAEFKSRVIASGPSARPGERFEYSNVGFTILGWVIESVERAPLDSVLRRRIFRPLAMTEAAYRVPLDHDSLRAQPHNVVDGTPVSVAYVSGGFGSGGMSLSILDLGKFASALQRSTLLPQAWRDSAWAGVRLADGRMSTTMMFGDTAQYGFGWFVARYHGRRAITHGGGINGYSTMLLHFPAESLTIGVIANARAPVEPIVRAIADVCLDDRSCGAKRGAPAARPG